MLIFAVAVTCFIMFCVSELLTSLVLEVVICCLLVLLLSR